MSISAVPWDDRSILKDRAPIPILLPGLCTYQLKLQLVLISKTNSFEKPLITGYQLVLNFDLFSLVFIIDFDTV